MKRNTMSACMKLSLIISLTLFMFPTIGASAGTGADVLNEFGHEASPHPTTCVDANRDGICDRLRPPRPCVDANHDGICDRPPPRPCVDANHDGICDRPPPRPCVDANRDGICDRLRPPRPCVDANHDGICDRRPPRPPPRPECANEAGREARRKADDAKRRLDALRDATAMARADPHHVYTADSPVHFIKDAKAEFIRWNMQAKSQGC
ncbi:hypothetical protein EMPS_07948 [Entomortierella parvispora]|uniref:Uncharacterized protein n=1 Tax=Entomortierella parvispora TaxID=205924 RepID=A0A9P3HFG2_9FUNG|nr:hypothetical protein EMPS_07948 [Entomortierella parvispora]